MFDKADYSLKKWRLIIYIGTSISLSAFLLVYNTWFFRTDAINVIMYGVMAGFGVIAIVTKLRLNILN